MRVSILHSTYHHCVSALEVKGVEATFQFVEVLGDLHVMVGWQPVPGGGDQIGKIACRILTEISNSGFYRKHGVNAGFINSKYFFQV